MTTVRWCRVCGRVSDAATNQTCPFCRARMRRIVADHDNARLATVKRDGDTTEERPFIIVCAGCGARGSSPVEPSPNQEAWCPRCVMLRMEQ